MMNKEQLIKWLEGQIEQCSKAAEKFNRIDDFYLNTHYAAKVEAYNTMLSFVLDGDLVDVDETFSAPFLKEER